MANNKNGTMMQYFEWYLPCDCSLWKKVKKEAPALHKAGITALWLPPATKGAFGKDGTGYSAYDLYDLGEFDQKGSIPTKYGTKAEYLAAIKACQKLGINVYADIVLNHKIGADGSEELDAVAYAADNRTLPVSGKEKILAWTRFEFPGRKGKYSDFVWDSSCFDGVDWDQHRKKSAIYLLEGHSWQSEVDSENGNYDYLMGADLDFDQQKVVDELTRWGKWYLDTTGVDGFRLDAVKHIKAAFYDKWLKDMRDYAGKELFSVGEYWSPDLAKLETYLGEVNGQLSLFDVPLHWNLHQCSVNGEGYDLRKIFDGTLTGENPAHSVPFVDNHDTEEGQALQSPVSNWFKPHAYALILLRDKGYPCVFYGDYYGTHGQTDSPLRPVLDKLLQIRAKYAYGPQHDYFDDPHCIGWTREEGGLAVILSTKYDHVKKMYVGEAQKGKTYVDVLGNRQEKVVIGEDGNGDFPVKDGFASVWLEEGKISTL